MTDVEGAEFREAKIKNSPVSCLLGQNWGDGISWLDLIVPPIPVFAIIEYFSLPLPFHGEASCIPADWAMTDVEGRNLVIGFNCSPYSRVFYNYYTVFLTSSTPRRSFLYSSRLNHDRCWGDGISWLDLIVPPIRVFAIIVSVFPYLFLSMEKLPVFQQREPWQMLRGWNLVIGFNCSPYSRVCYNYYSVFLTSSSPWRSFLYSSRESHDRCWGDGISCPKSLFKKR